MSEDVAPVRRQVPPAAGGGSDRGEDRHGAPPEAEIIVDLRIFDGATRYERRSRDLPHLSDDATWSLDRESLPNPVVPAQLGFLRRLLGARR